MFEQAFEELKSAWKAEVTAELKATLESDGHRYLTIRDSAKYMGCSYEMVRTLGASGAFTIVHLGNQKRVIDRRDIDAYMTSLKRKQMEQASPISIDRRAA